MRVNFSAVVLLSSSMMVFAAPALADTPESIVRAINAYSIQGDVGSSVVRSRVSRAKDHHTTRRSRLSSRHGARGRNVERTHRETAERVRRRSVAAKSAHVAGHNGDDSFASVSAGTSPLVSEARRWIGTNPTGRASLWCARFMNFVLKRVGLNGTSSDMARSFASYGRRVSGPRVGAIAVMGRGRSGGHVGVVSGIDAKGNPIIISGNYGRRVAEAKYPRGRIYAYVMP
jgi:uncharacterized protein (TIGR02594 family)